MFTSDDRQTLALFKEKGKSTGVAPDDLRAAFVVYQAICSGELALPWSQEETEMGFADWLAPVQAVQRLMASQPQFSAEAFIWYENKYGFLPL